MKQLPYGSKTELFKNSCKMKTVNEGGYLKIGPSWDLFSKQNIFMTKRDMKNPKSGSCRGRLGLSFYEKSVVNT